jgi:putative holliday junction resolvase
VTRVLALDLGTVRIGIALSDPTGAVAAPLETMVHRARHKNLAAVAALAEAHGVERIVVGWPRNMDGTSGPAARRAEAFAAALRQVVHVPVDLWDERLSTAAAERTLRDAGVRRGRRRAVRDQVAAALILQTYLTARPWGREVPGSEKPPGASGPTPPPVRTGPGGP